ncbi:putative ATP/GTP-binding protein [Betaentomopoxvirus amoorei]|uniref:DNA packaging protein OPG160 n=1 Tax=Amsacta moorei entomopoxvirus TaxID=28321 RepID=Q9EMP9_AMEPV|nr:putative ATP/GTP-binding protein [Amsacta moorei entomopoxvirus]AAG02856.1 AMV150 [Amsacta moorei entomopoxvirus]
MSEFDYDKLRAKPFNMAIIGKTGSGKTTFLKNLLLKIGYGFYKFIYLITSSEVNFKSNEYFKFIYPNHVFYLYSNNKDKDVKYLLQAYLEKIKNFSFEMNQKCENFRTLVIYDDIGKDTKDKLSNFTNVCRHSLVSNIFLVHRLEHLDTTTRDSLSYHVINSESENMDLIPCNKNLRNSLLASVINIFKDREQSKYYIYCIIYDSVSYSCLISDDDLENIKNEDKYVFYTDSVIKSHILN